jgi:hypothetical protein
MHGKRGKEADASLLVTCGSNEPSRVLFLLPTGAEFLVAGIATCAERQVHVGPEAHPIGDLRSTGDDYIP